MGMIQVRVDDELKKTAEYVFKEIGLDLSSAIRMFLKKSCMEHGLPFDPTIDEDNYNWLLSMRLYTMSDKEKEKLKEWDLDKINEQIQLSRLERDKKTKWFIMRLLTQTF